VHPRVVIFGLDGASFRVIDPLLRKGELPGFSNAIDRGVRSVLLSTVPDVTPPSWTSMTTGVNPGKHGVYDFLKVQEDGTTRIVTSVDRMSPSVWDILSHNKMRVIVVNVPVTYPPQPVNGIMISDMLTPEGATDIVYPAFLSRTLEKRGYEVGIRWAGGGVSTKVGVEEMKLHLRERMQAFTWLLEHFEWDFAMVVVNETDFVQHLFPGDTAKISSVYREADEAVGNLMRRLDEETTLFLVSDHGFNIARRALRINDWLVQKGVQKLAGPARTGVAGRAVDFMLKRETTSRVARLVEKHAPRRVLRMVQTSPLEGGRIPTGLSCLTPQPHSYVPLIVNGRFTPAGYEQLLEAVVRGSAELLDGETGLRPILKVMTKRELYEGLYSTDAPDLLLQLHENYVVSEKIFNSKELFHKTVQGVHEPSGILIAEGRSVKPLVEAESHTVLDITPTVLHLLGIRPPGRLDGRVMHDLLIS